MDIELIAKVILFYISCSWSIFAANNNQVASVMRIVNKFGDNIGMSFGIDKCKKLTIQRGKIVHMENIQIDDEELKLLELNQQYKS